jgi:hypothetical protein
MVIGVINTPFGAFQQGVECHVCEGIGQTIHHNVRVVMVMVYHLSRKLLMLLFLLVFFDNMTFVMVKVMVLKVGIW